jgi:hypothetical protein
MNVLASKSCAPNPCITITSCIYQVMNALVRVVPLIPAAPGRTMSTRRRATVNSVPGDTCVPQLPTSLRHVPPVSTDFVIIVMLLPVPIYSCIPLVE